MTCFNERALRKWPGYTITSDGRVFSVASNWHGGGKRELIQGTNKYGYKTVRLVKDGRRIAVTVHRLVASAYLRSRPSEMHQIRHLNGSKEDNSALNLCWGSSAENAQDREAHGRTSRGVSHSEAIKRGLRKSGHDHMRRASPFMLEALEAIEELTNRKQLPLTSEINELAAAAIKKARE